MYIALSNMPVFTVNIGDCERFCIIRHVTTNFDKTPRIPPYLVTIVLSNFPNIVMKRINFRCRQQTILHLKYAETVIKNVMLQVESQWTHCKRLVNVDHVAVPGFDQESMNNLGLVFYK